MNQATRFTRRLFFRQAAAAGLPFAGVQAEAKVVHEPPKRCWTVMGTNWDFNEEYTYPEGQCATGMLFYSEEEAQAACRKLNDEFFASEDPQPYDAEFHDEPTWENLREDGFSDPFFVQELTCEEPFRSDSSEPGSNSNKP